MVRDASVAVSIARSAMSDWGIGWGVSILTIACAPNFGLRPETATFGYPRVRSF
jgi:hypothetical protein